ncbi:MAG: hypothetical protein ACQETH_17445 [Candidatus Rifleibacteriota bacterium]
MASLTILNKIPYQRLIGKSFKYRNRRNCRSRDIYVAREILRESFKEEFDCGIKVAFIKHRFLLFQIAGGDLWIRNNL